nr:TIGR01212 family radical SAM protein [Eubacterium sp.]
MTKHRWGEKPYHSLDFEMKKRFGGKVYKISLDGGMTCPNRDGTIGTGGCIFCSGNGSGDFAVPLCSSVTEQIDTGIAGISSRKHVGEQFIAYFQSFTNTYAPIETLRALYMEALQHPNVVMLSVATRPDCLPAEVLSLLEECNNIKPVIVELGLQTMHEPTAQYIRRGYPLEVYDTAVESLKKRNLEVVTHVIAGLPGETQQDFLDTIDHVAEVGSHGIKIQLLHILKGTDLASHYKQGLFEALTMDEYISLVLRALSRLPEDIIIHRLTGDGPKELLIAPTWSSKKRYVLNEIHRQLKLQNIWQGKEKKE